MNPLALLLLAAAAGGGRMPRPQGGAFKLDTVLDQLHGAVNTLEKVSELSRMGNAAVSSFSLPSPSAGHIPVNADPADVQDNGAQPSAPSLPNIDLQNAMQTLAPILSMLGNNQNSR